MFSPKQWIAIVLCLIATGGGGLGYYHWRDHRQDTVILEAARRYHADPALIKAVIWRETWFDPTRVGHSGEIGLMQLRTLSAKEWVTAEHIPGFQSTDLFDPRTNTYAGTWYFTKLLRRYARTDNPIPYTLADYNAGRSHVLQWSVGPAATNSEMFLQTISFPGTRAYIETIVRQYDHYREIFPPRNASN